MGRSGAWLIICLSLGCGWRIDTCWVSVILSDALHGMVSFLVTFALPDDRLVRSSRRACWCVCVGLPGFVPWLVSLTLPGLSDA